MLYDDWGTKETSGESPRLPTPILWTPMHLAELERMFPERSDLQDTNGMIYRAGQRSVVAAIRNKVNAEINRHASEH